MFFQSTGKNIDQIIDKALNFIMPAQDGATIEDTVQVMQQLHEHFADPVYGLRSGYMIGNLYQSNRSSERSH